MYTFAQSCLCIIRARGFFVCTPNSIFLIFTCFWKRNSERTSALPVMHFMTQYMSCCRVFFEMLWLNNGIYWFLFFILILLIQRWLQKTMCAVGTDVFVEVSKEWFQPTSLSLPFCLQNEEMGCSGTKFDTEQLVQQNKTCWSFSHARLNRDFSCYFCTIEAFFFCVILGIILSFWEVFHINCCDYSHHKLLIIGDAGG